MCHADILRLIFHFGSEYVIDHMDPPLVINAMKQSRPIHIRDCQKPQAMLFTRSPKPAP